jgi:chromosome segregation protein
VIRRELSTLNAERDQAEAANQEVNAQIQEVIRKERDKNEQMNVCLSMHNKNESKLNRLKEEQDRLSGSLWNEYEISYEQAKALDYPPVTAENRSEVVAEQTSNKMRIRALGSVNVGAIEEYASVKERYDKMNLQVTDLSNSCDNLQKIVSQIEDEMRQCFLETFTQINKNFGEVFSELFGGGTGELSLTDPSDVLSCGIEIKAAPPGKIIKSLSLLSGGEQAFVAIALFFAILRVNPTPFCILDEIEAALDEVNVFRFGEYIKKFCDDTQFVLITHRRGTMEVAERLYGITMPEKGVSRAIALDVNEIESKKKELLPDEVF